MTAWAVVIKTLVKLCKVRALSKGFHGLVTVPVVVTFSGEMKNN